MEVVRRGDEAFSRGDMAAVMEGYDPDVEYWARADDPDATVRRGRDAVLASFAELSESYADLRIEPTEFIDAGGFVVVPVRVTVRGRASGAVAESDQVFTYRLKAGRVIGVREYRDKAEALEAAALAP